MWRDDLTHGNAPRLSAAKDAIALHELTVRLAAALNVNLLLNLGFSLDEIRELYQRCEWERLFRLESTPCPRARSRLSRLRADAPPTADRGAAGFR
jgi:hypothetical protein